MTRANMSAARRADWHRAEMGRARTPKTRLWKACGWLVAEAWRRNRIDEAMAVVLTAVDDLRNEEVRP